MKQIIPRGIPLTGSALLFIWLLAVPSIQPDAGANQETPEKILAATYKEDLAAFKRLRRNLFQLSADIDSRKDLFGPRPMEDPALLQPEMRRQIMSLWYPILDTYLALDALAEKYMAFPLIENIEEQKRAFHLARGIFLTQYRVALDIITELKQNPSMDTILNEADALMGLSPGVYAHFKYQYLNIIKAGRYAALEAVALMYKTPADARMAQWAEEDSRVILAAGKGPGPKMTFNNGIAIVKRFGHTAWFPLQKGVAEWMGKTKVWRQHHYLIEPEQIRILSERLEPGDILLERREWYLTNVGIPGFWTHAALFIGSPDQRKALSQTPEIKEWLSGQNAESIDDLIRTRYPKASAALHKPYKDSRLPQVIEAISPGVSLTSLHYSATCDSLAVLRPRLSKTDRAAAVVRAMRYYSRPYDYDFDFISDGSLVCTELVVKSYLPGDKKQGLQLPFEKVMGQMVTPANAFVQQFDTTFGTPAQQMDLVLFLDGNEKEKRAVESDVTAFRKSWNRPKWHILVDYAPMLQKTEKE